MEDAYLTLREVVKAKALPILEGFNTIIKDAIERIPAAKTANAKDFIDRACSKSWIVQGILMACIVENCRRGHAIRRIEFVTTKCHAQLFEHVIRSIPFCACPARGICSRFRVALALQWLFKGTRNPGEFHCEDLHLRDSRGGHEEPAEIWHASDFLVSASTLQRCRGRPQVPALSNSAFDPQFAQHFTLNRKINDP